VASQASHVAAGGPVVLGLPAALAHGQQHEQAPQAVPAVQVELAPVAAAEEAAVNRLEHVLGVELGAERAVEAAAGQGDEPAGEAVEDARRGVRTAGAQPDHQLLE
jgi:hypothetical protein